jgi:hypothetical protein
VVRNIEDAKEFRVLKQSAKFNNSKLTVGGEKKKILRSILHDRTF